MKMHLPPSQHSPPSPRSTSAPASRELARVIARLRHNGLRLTPGRAVMLAALLRHDAPLTLARLQAAILPQRIALTTLFRSMLRLEEIELVTRSIDRHGTANWQLNLGRPRQFPVTLRDRDESTVLDAADAASLRDLLTRLEQRLLAHGYTHLQFSVSFHATSRESTSPALPATQRHVA